MCSGAGRRTAQQAELNFATHTYKIEFLDTGAAPGKEDVLLVLCTVCATCTMAPHPFFFPRAAAANKLRSSSVRASLSRLSTLMTEARTVHILFVRSDSEREN